MRSPGSATVLLGVPEEGRDQAGEEAVTLLVSFGVRWVPISS